MFKIVNGVERELGLTDFIVNKLSDRLSLIEFNGYSISEKSAKIDGRDVKYNVFTVRCTNHFNNRQISVSLSYEGSNKGILDQLQFKLNDNPLDKVFIDFEDVVIGHYVSGGGNFSQLAQTYRAEKIRIVERNEAEKIMQQLKQLKPTVNKQNDVKPEHQK